MRHFSAAENLKHLMSYYTLEYELSWNVPGWIPNIPEYALKCQIPYHLFQDVEWKLREHLNELKKAAGEAWQEDLGAPFMGCGSNTPINLLPRITA